MIPLEEMARLDAMASRQLHVSAAEVVGEDGVGFAIAGPVRLPFWGKTTGVVGPSFVYTVQPVGEANLDHEYLPVDPTQAWEANFNAAVPTGSAVLCWPSEGAGGARWKFAYEPAGGGGF